MTTRPVALVSGGSRGIGRAVVARLARDGFDVALCFRDRADAAAQARADAESFGARAVCHRVDVTDPGQCRALVERTEDELGPVDLVVTAAGITRDRPLALMEDAQWTDVLRTNLDGTYHVCRPVIERMARRRSGAVVTISSVAGVHGSAGQANYSASKAGIIGFTRAVAKEYGRFGVRANAVAPGFIETEMTAAVPERARDRYLRQVSLARFGAAEEVADLVAFLASRQASYITGQVISVDGGLAG